MFEEEDKWYIDSGCSHHMSGNKRKIISLKKNKSGNIILGNSSSSKVLGMGNVELDIKSIEVANVFLVDGLKDRILSVGKIVDKGKVIVSTFTRCKIVKEGTRKTIAKGFKMQKDYMY